jgi:hypothetical protein
MVFSPTRREWHRYLEEKGESFSSLKGNAANFNAHLGEFLNDPRFVKGPDAERALSDMFQKLHNPNQ